MYGNALLSNTSREVYDDWGYLSAAREAWLKAKGLRNQIQRMAKCGKPLFAYEHTRHRGIAKTHSRRACVCGHRSDGQEDDPRHLSSARELRDDDDGTCYNMKRLLHFRNAVMEAS